MPGAKWLLLTLLVLFFIRFLIQYGWVIVGTGGGPTLARKINQWTCPQLVDPSTRGRALFELPGTGMFPMEGSIAHGALYRIVMSCILTISVFVVFFLCLDFPELPLISEMRSGSQEYQKKDLRCFIRMLTPKDLWPFLRILTPDFTFAIAMIDVMDSALSAGEMREWAQNDGVRWTPGHSMYAAIGGFIIQQPDTTTSKELRLQRPLQLSPRALLQMRRAGLLEKLPDIDMTQRFWKKNNLTGNLLISVFVLFLVQLSIRWIKNVPVSQLEILTGVFSTYTVITYTLVGDDIFSRRPSTAVPLQNAEDFWYRIGKGSHLLSSISSQPSPSDALWIKVATHRRLQNYPIDRPSMSFWLGLLTAYLISGALQVIVWNCRLLTPIEWKARIILWSFYFFVLIGLNYREIWFSVRMSGVLAGVGLILGSALVLHRFFLVWEVIFRILIFGW